jgi:hypothetical protein
MHCQCGFQAMGFFRPIFIFYWKRTIFLPSIVSGLANAGIFILAIVYWYICFLPWENLKLSCFAAIFRWRIIPVRRAHNCWFTSRPATGSCFSFIDCTVSPGFEFGDFELADAPELIKIYPEHTDIINELCS